MCWYYFFVVIMGLFLHVFCFYVCFMHSDVYGCKLLQVDCSVVLVYPIAASQANCSSGSAQTCCLTSFQKHTSCYLSVYSNCNHFKMVPWHSDTEQKSLQGESQEIWKPRLQYFMYKTYADLRYVTNITEFNIFWLRYMYMYVM